MKNLFLLVVLSFVFASCGFEIVDDGYVGVKRSLGEIDPNEYPAGIHFYNPFITSIFEMEVREKAFETTISAYSADNQVIEAAVKANYKPVSNMIAELYVSQGEDYVDVLLPQRVAAASKEILGKFKATDISENRAKINAEIAGALREKMVGTNIELVSFEVTNYDYDDSFEAAVKAKVVAIEKATEEKNRTVQIQEQAKQKLEMAKAEAESIKIQAAALKENKSLVELEAVKKWNGALPQYMMGNSVPFINVGK